MDANIRMNFKQTVIVKRTFPYESLQYACINLCLSFYLSAVSRVVSNINMLKNHNS